MQSTPRALVRARAACLVVAAIAIFLVVRRIHATALAETFRSAKPGWFLAAFLLYGFLFLPAAWRWHLALRLSESAVNFAASLRLSLIGHFFYTILFGAAGGDAAKSLLY